MNVLQWQECCLGDGGYNRWQLLCTVWLPSYPCFRHYPAHQHASLDVQDTFARTSLHVAATCGSIEVVSMMCKFEGVHINPVDSFGHTPLDNALMTGQRAVVALLEDVGALSGSDPSLAPKVEEVRGWMRAEETKRRANRLEEVLAGLPEEKAVQESEAIIKAQTEFVQVGSEGASAGLESPFDAAVVRNSRLVCSRLHVEHPPPQQLSIILGIPKLCTCRQPM